ncbi:hypothetical protein NDU88_004074 [Pleurodeles waltl]|uniref:Uncharacterized protein n=1 Tax=Pleurodeles waltl TaxID=8319 RepID=A0AAV7MSM0_PLEWA|nr:hypothetical protein NDU88_004074 [Pleurodeles waltl]
MERGRTGSRGVPQAAPQPAGPLPRPTAVQAQQPSTPPAIPRGSRTGRPDRRAHVSPAAGGPPHLPIHRTRRVLLPRIQQLITGPSAATFVSLRAAPGTGGAKLPETEGEEKTSSKDARNKAHSTEGSEEASLKKLKTRGINGRNTAKRLRDIQHDIVEFFEINEGTVDSVSTVWETFKAYLKAICISEQFSFQKDVQPQLELLEICLRQLERDLETACSQRLLAELEAAITEYTALEDRKGLYSHNMISCAPMGSVIGLVEH